MYPLLCRWVPGTLDRVRLEFLSLHHEQVLELDMATASRLLGRRSLDDLYTKGRVRLSVCQETRERLALYAPVRTVADVTAVDPVSSLRA